MSRNQIEFANVLCHFGKHKVLLDYLTEVILPAFTDDTLIRERGRETPTSYHFYEVKVEVLDKTTQPPLIGVSGEFVKDVNLTRTQVYDAKKGLIEDYSSMPSSPSSYFLFLFNNHQLIYLPKTPHAPSIKEFASTLSFFVKKKHLAYITHLFNVAQSENNPVTKASLYREHPTPSIEIVPIGTEDSVSEFIKRFSKLQVMQFKLLKPNPTINAQDTFKNLQGILAELHANSGQVITRSNEGLDQNAAIRIVGEAAAVGTNDIKLQGNGHDGTTLSGSNDDFKIRVSLDAVPPTRDGVVKALLRKFRATLSHLDSNGSDGNEIHQEKISELAKEL